MKEKSNANGEDMEIKVNEKDDSFGVIDNRKAFDRVDSTNIDSKSQVLDKDYIEGANNIIVKEDSRNLEYTMKDMIAVHDKIHVEGISGENHKQAIIQSDNINEENKNKKVESSIDLHKVIMSSRSNTGFQEEGRGGEVEIFQKCSTPPPKKILQGEGLYRLKPTRDGLTPPSPPCVRP